MIPSQEMKELARATRFEFAKATGSMESFADVVMQHLDSGNLAELRSSVSAVLNSQMSSHELAEYWSRLPSNMYIEDGEKVRLFLMAVLKRLGD